MVGVQGDGEEEKKFEELLFWLREENGRQRGLDVVALNCGVGVGGVV